MFPPLAIGRLVRYFRNPAIGLVTGYTNYTMSESGEMARTTNIYTSLERAIKIGESQWGYCVGADGAIFAMRRSLYRPLRDDDINDFVLPLTVIEQQSSCVFAADAHCSEAPGNNLESEFRRQSRITNRTLLALWRHRHLLNPMRFGWFSFFLLSHKVFRFLVPAFLLLSAVSLAWLAQSRSVYQVLALGALAAIVLAADATASSAIRRSGLDRLLGFLNTFLMINLAVLLGWWHFLRGQRDTMWQHDRLQGENT